MPEEKNEEWVENVKRNIFNNLNISNFNSIFFKSWFKMVHKKLVEVFDVLFQFSVDNLLHMGTQQKKDQVAELLDHLLESQFMTMKNLR